MVEESAFRGVINILAKIGVYDIVLPFLLVFTIIFAILVISLALYFFTLIGKYFIMEGKKRQLRDSGRIKHHSGTRSVKV